MPPNSNDNECFERRLNMENLVARVAQLENLVEHLINEARINNRIAIVAICVMAAGKEILTFIK